MSKYKIKQYIPSFITGFESDYAEFNTIEELLEIEFVKKWVDLEKRYEGYKSKGFFVGDNHIFHIGYDPNNNETTQWGVARIIEGDVNKLSELLYDKYQLKSLHLRGDK